MSTHHRIPQNVRALFDGMPQAESQTSQEITGPELQLVPAVTEAATAPLEPVIRFTIEAQIEMLDQILDEIDARQPDLWRQTDESRVLLDTMQVLLNREPVN